MASDTSSDPAPTREASAHAPVRRVPVDRVVHPEDHNPVAVPNLTETESRLLGDLFAIVEEHAGDSIVDIDKSRVQDAFVFSCEHHADQRRKSGEDFITHPVGVAKICRSEEHTSELQSPCNLV